MQRTQDFQLRSCLRQSWSWSWWSDTLAAAPSSPVFQAWILKWLSQLPFWKRNSGHLEKGTQGLENWDTDTGGFGPQVATHPFPHGVSTSFWKPTPFSCLYPSNLHMTSAGHRVAEPQIPPALCATSSDFTWLIHSSNYSPHESN